MERQAVLILGVHRSGTSALAGCLVHLGVQAPKTLMPPQPDNPAGYWESTTLYELHERILRLAGSKWYDWTPLDRAWFDSEPAAACEAECRASIGREFDLAPLFAVKDPRICRFVPFWLKNLAALDIAAKPVLLLRSPLEVAFSLQARDGFGPERSLLIWLRHVLDAEADTRGMRRALVRYDHLLSDWRSVAARISSDIEVEWPNQQALTDPAVSAEVRPELRHYEVGLEALPGSSRLRMWISQTWRALDLLSRSSTLTSAEAFGILDNVKSELDLATSIVSPAVRDELRVLDQQIARADRFGGELDRRRHELEAERAQNQDLRGTLAAAHARLEWLEQERNRSHSTVTDLQRDLLGACARIDGLTDERATAERRIAALMASASWRVTAPLRAAFRLVTRRES